MGEIGLENSAGREVMADWDGNTSEIICTRVIESVLTVSSSHFCSFAGMLR